ncbi:conjugal transfer protein TraF [Desulfocurvibacter africanus]|uniref:conjugal transfer protein TraF n=1 Tax=Desulfocurvibacter africanus TaxID=873 RepID=UPI000415E8CD|nr:conjugal transfer protein TraF [Desulfocurvibacter africanus]
MHRISSRALRLAVGAALSGVLALPSTALALDTFFVGPRAMGMAGANVASVTDTTAQYYNPAAFGFFGMVGSEMDKKGKTVEKRLTSDNNNVGRKDWGWDVVSAGGGIRAHNDLGDIINDLAGVDLDEIENGVQTKDELDDLILLANKLELLENPGNGLTASVNGGTALRAGSFCLGVRGYGQGAVHVLGDIDTTNLGIEATDMTDLSGQIVSAANSAGYSTDPGQVSLLTADQVTILTNAGFTPAAIAAIDSAAQEQGITQQDIAPLVSTMEDVAQATSSSSGSLDDNQTTVLVSGFGLAEVPLSFGYAFNEYISVGGNIKAMMGRVYATEVRVFDSETEEIFSEAEESYEESMNFGVDLGVMGRVRWFQAGIVGRNLNSPKFKGPEITRRDGTVVQFEDVTVKPQFAAGLALIPFETFTIEADIDLNKNETALEGYETQFVRVGAEWDILRFLALRGGFYTNLAEDDIGIVYTAGLGLNLWAVRLDVGGAFSAKTMEYDGNDIPKEMQLVAGLSIDF